MFHDQIGQTIATHVDRRNGRGMVQRDFKVGPIRQEILIIAPIYLDITPAINKNQIMQIIAVEIGGPVQ